MSKKFVSNEELKALRSRHSYFFNVSKPKEHKQHETIEKIVNGTKKTVRKQFDIIVKAYAQNQGETELNALAKALTYSVLKKCIDKGFQKTLLDMKNSLTSDLIKIDNETFFNGAFSIEYTRDGKIKECVIDKDLKKAVDNMYHGHTFGNGLSLYNDAVIAILGETEKQILRGENVNLEKEYEVTRLKAKVRIKEDDSKGGYETVTTTPLHEIYKAIRRSIESNRSIYDNRYFYIDSIEGDGIRKIKPCYENSKHRTKYKSTEEVKTKEKHYEYLKPTDEFTYESLEQIISLLNLSDRQAVILDLRLRGYGKKAIATYLDIDKNNVARTLKQIGKKAIDKGIAVKVEQ